MFKTEFASALSKVDSQLAYLDATAGRMVVDVVRSGLAVIDTPAAAYRMFVNGEYNWENGLTLAGAVGAPILKIGGKFIDDGIGIATETVAGRSAAAQNILQARNLLREAGVPLKDRNVIIRSFDLPTFRVETTSSGMKAYRVFDDADAVLRGRYVSTDFIASQTDRIQDFALMSNSARARGIPTVINELISYSSHKISHKFDCGLTRSEAFVGELKIHRNS